MNKILIALSFMFASSIANATSPDRLNFEYQSLLEPFPNFSCRHQLSSSGIYDWDVECNVDGKVRKYFAHVVVTFYPKTKWGVNSYEVLYWVTDATDPKKYQHSSSTVWIHNSSSENSMHVIELSQGVENDDAALKLSFFPE